MTTEHKIVEKETGRRIVPGSLIYSSAAVAAPGTWRLESHVQHPRTGDHMLHCSRFVGRRRIHRTFHPNVFGFTVEIDVVWYRACFRKVRHTWHETYVGIYLGFLALVGLAFFEQYHLAPEIVESVTFGFMGSTGGH